MISTERTARRRVGHRLVPRLDETSLQNERVPMKLLVIGGGSIGERHLRCFQKTGRADVSLCEINAGLRTQLVDEYGVANSFADFEEAVASGPDAGRHLPRPHTCTFRWQPDSCRPARMC